MKEFEHQSKPEYIPYFDEIESVLSDAFREWFRNRIRSNPERYREYLKNCLYTGEEVIEAWQLQPGDLFVELEEPIRSGEEISHRIKMVVKTPDGRVKVLSDRNVLYFHPKRLFILVEKSQISNNLYKDGDNTPDQHTSRRQNQQKKGNPQRRKKRRK